MLSLPNKILFALGDFFDAGVLLFLDFFDVGVLFLDFLDAGVLFLDFLDTGVLLDLFFDAGGVLFLLDFDAFPACVTLHQVNIKST